MLSREVFINLYKKGLIYKGSKIVNWCQYVTLQYPMLKWNMRSKQDIFGILLSSSGRRKSLVEIATTRPETLLGDTAPVNR